MVKTSPDRTVWLGLAALARLTRTLPSWTSWAASVRDFDDARKPKPLVEPLGLGREPASPSSLSAAHRGPEVNPGCAFPGPPSASSAPQTANRDRRRPSAWTGEACRCGRGRSSRRLGTLAAVIAAPERTLALACALALGAGPWRALVALPGPCAPSLWREWCGRFSRSGRSKARPLRRGRQTSSHSPRPRLGRGGRRRIGHALPRLASAGC